MSQSGNRVAISPDGKRIVYVGPAQRGTQLWVREHDQLSSTPIPGTERCGHAVLLARRPPGRVRARRDEDPDRVARRRPHPVAHRQRQHDRRRLGTGRLRVLRGGLGDRARPRHREGRSSRSTISSATRKPARNGRWCCPAARGCSSAPAARTRRVGDFQIVAMALPHGEPHVLMRGVYARYSPTGHLLVVTADGKLVAAPFDLKQARAHRRRRSGCSRGSGSKWADSRPTWPCPTTAPWSTPPAPRCGAGSPYG